MLCMVEYQPYRDTEEKTLEHNHSISEHGKVLRHALEQNSAEYSAKQKECIIL